MEIATLIISVLTLLTTIAGIVVSVVLYKKQKKDAALAEKKRKEEEWRDAKDKLDAIGVIPFGAPGFSRMDLAKVAYLKVKARRR
ncbi:MAG: hypothetical protein Q4E52_07255 [Fibrobacter sp.]|nr:hypothetical protein [Fibrobacter sp.]